MGRVGSNLCVRSHLKSKYDKGLYCGASIQGHGESWVSEQLYDPFPTTALLDTSGFVVPRFLSKQFFTRNRLKTRFSLQ